MFNCLFMSGSVAFKMVSTTCFMATVESMNKRQTRPTLGVVYKADQISHVFQRVCVCVCE